MSAKAKQELLIAVVIYAIVGFFFAAGLKLLPDSRRFPNIILFLMALANTINVFMIVGKDRKDRAAGVSEAKTMTFADIKFPLLAFLGTVVYAALFVLTNYFIATAVFIVAFMLIEKVRPIWLIAAITVGYSAFIYWLFVVQLSVRLIR